MATNRKRMTISMDDETARALEALSAVSLMPQSMWAAAILRMTTPAMWALTEQMKPTAANFEDVENQLETLAAEGLIRMRQGALDFGGGRRRTRRDKRGG